MAFVPAPNIIMCEIRGQKDGQLIENRIMVDALHDPTPADLQTMVDVLTFWINNTYKTLVPVDVTFTGLKITSLKSINAIQLTTGLAIVGTIANPSAPNEVSYCISLRTGLSGRSARGRFYWLGLALASIGTQNRVGAPFRTLSTAAIQTLIGAITAANFRWVIVSYRTNKAPRVGGPVYFPVLTATTTSDVVDSQRRRRPGIGA